MGEANPSPERAEEIARGLNKRQRDVMGSFRPEVYAINFHRDRVKDLVELGLLEWLPPVWGNETNWGATPLGLAVAKHLKGKTDE